MTIQTEAAAGLADPPAAPPTAAAEPQAQAEAGAPARLLSAMCFWGVLALVPLTAIPYGSVEPWWQALFQCLVFLLTSLWLLDVALFGGAQRLRKLSLLLPFAALALYAHVQTVSWGTATEPLILAPVNLTISADPSATRAFVLQFAAVALAAWLLFQYADNERRLRALCYAVIATALGFAVFALCRQSMQGDTVGFWLPHLRPGEGYGQFINRNHFAYLMEMGIGLTAGLTLAAKGRAGVRLVYVAMLILMGATIVFSASRGGMLSMVCQFLLVGVFFDLVGRGRHKASGLQDSGRIKRNIARGGLTFCLLLALGFGIVWVGGDRLANRVSDSVSSDTDETRTNAARTDIWRMTIRMFKDNPVAGVGFGGYWIAVAQYNDASGRVAPQEAHNDYLELLASGGLVGAAIGGWMLLGVTAQARRCFRSGHSPRRALCFGALVGICGVGVHSLFDFGLHVPANALAFAALVVLAVREVPEPEKAGTESAATGAMAARHVRGAARRRRVDSERTRVAGGMAPS